MSFIFSILSKKSQDFWFYKGKKNIHKKTKVHLQFLHMQNGHGRTDILLFPPHTFISALLRAYLLRKNHMKTISLVVNLKILIYHHLAVQFFIKKDYFRLHTYRSFVSLRVLFVIIYSYSLYYYDNRNGSKTLLILDTY